MKRSPQAFIPLPASKRIPHVDADNSRIPTMVYSFYTFSNILKYTIYKVLNYSDFAFSTQVNPTSNPPPPPGQRKPPKTHKTKLFIHACQNHLYIDKTAHNTTETATSVDVL